MRKTLIVTAYLLVSALVFVATWQLAGRGDNNVAPPATVQQPGEGTPTTEPGGVPTGTENTSPAETVPDGNQVPGAGSLTTKLLEPPHAAELARRLSSYMALEGVNPLAAARVVTYSIITYGDVKRPDGRLGLISTASAGTENREALHAAAWVAAEVAELPGMKKDILEWVDAPAGRTKTVVDAVLSRAAGDGYAEAGKTKGAGFTGELGWRPGGTVFPDGLEPGWGSLKPILGKAGCSVPDPKTDTLKAQYPAVKEAVAKVSETVDDQQAFETFAKDNRYYWLNTPVLNPAMIALGAYVTTTGETRVDMEPDAEIRAIYALAGTYDTLITTWGAKWKHGVAGPLDLFPIKDSDGDVVFHTSAPSYPSWVGAFQSFMEDYASSSTGKTLTFAAADDRMGMVDAAERSLEDPLMHWAEDIAAGRDLGSCYAKHAFEALKNNK
jgi:hypothetical protein